MSSGEVVAFTSPGYPNYYNGDQSQYFWSFDASNLAGDQIIKFVFHPYVVSVTSYVAFGNGLDISNHTSSIAYYDGNSDDLYTFYSQESRVWVEFYTGEDIYPYQGFSATAEAIRREGKEGSSMLD